MADPPRPFLTEEQIRELSDREKAVAIAEWSSYNARLRREQEQRSSRGMYRGGRARGARGRGRGYYGSQAYQQYSTTSYRHQPYKNLSATFHQSTHSDTPPSGTTTPKLTSANGIEKDMNSDTERTTKEKTPCPAFTSSGVCKRPRCPHAHDPDKTAICKPFLFKGECSKGQACPLSHEPSPKRSPNCIHFQNNSCNKDDCRYSHINVNVDAPVCDAFARLGYCEKGDKCADRHAFECPNFTNTGACDAKNCRLPHIVDAGRLRRARMSSSEVESPANPSSPENGEEKADNIDQDHALTQQADFIPFES